MQKSKNRINFFLNHELSQKVYKLSKQTKKSISDITREALAHYLESIEKIRIDKELEEGYAANSSYFKKQQEEWKHADSE